MLMQRWNVLNPCACLCKNNQKHKIKPELSLTHWFQLISMQSKHATPLLFPVTLRWAAWRAWPSAQNTVQSAGRVLVKLLWIEHHSMREYCTYIVNAYQNTDMYLYVLINQVCMQRKVWYVCTHACNYAVIGDTIFLEYIFWCLWLWLSYTIMMYMELQVWSSKPML